MALASENEYIVISLSGERVKGCRFRKKGSCFQITAHTAAAIDPVNPADAMKKVLDDLNYSANCILIITGALSNGTFFRTSGVVMPIKDQRNALEFELPQRILKVPDDCRFQFVSFNPSDGLPGSDSLINVYAFAASGMDRIAAMLTQSRCKADEFIYPLLGLTPSDPAVYLPEIEPDFCFEDGEWRPLEKTPNSIYAAWEKIFQKTFSFPTISFQMKDYIDCLLVMRFLASPEFKRGEPGIRVMPPALRPSRYRAQLILAIFLLTLIFGTWFVEFATVRVKNYYEYRDLTYELEGYKRDAATLKNNLKKNEREIKELTAITKNKIGEGDMLGKFADISEVLPQDVMAMRISYNGTALTLEMQSESENLNLSQAIQKIPYWKIESLVQRRMGNSSIQLITLQVSLTEGSK